MDEHIIAHIVDQLNDRHPTHPITSDDLVDTRIDENQVIALVNYGIGGVKKFALDLPPMPAPKPKRIRKPAAKRTRKTAAKRGGKK